MEKLKKVKIKTSSSDTGRDIPIGVDASNIDTDASHRLVSDEQIAKWNNNITPIATTAIAGKVKPDGTTITVTQEGTISAIGGKGTCESVPLATIEKAGIVKPDGSTITITESGTISTVNSQGAAAQVDWSQSDPENPAYIQNRCGWYLESKSYYAVPKQNIQFQMTSENTCTGEGRCILPHGNMEPRPCPGFTFKEALQCDYTIKIDDVLLPIIDPSLTSPDAGPMMLFGNASLLSPENPNTGEDMVLGLMWAPEYPDLAPLYFYCMGNSTQSEHTVEIFISTKMVKPVDERYLPKIDVNNIILDDNHQFITTEQKSKLGQFECDFHSHNAFRGKKLGTSFSHIDLKHLTEGSYEDLYVGDYWEDTSGGSDALHIQRWRIAGINYFRNVDKPHLIVVPDRGMGIAAMLYEDNSVKKVGYTGTDVFKNNIGYANQKAEKFFPGHIEEHEVCLCNTIDEQGKPKSTSTYRVKGCLLSERMVYGSSLFGFGQNSKDLCAELTQLPLYAQAPDLIPSTWLRDTTSVSEFSFIVSNVAGCDKADRRHDLIPYFVIA